MAQELLPQRIMGDFTHDHGVLQRLFVGRQVGQLQHLINGNHFFQDGNRLIVLFALTVKFGQLTELCC
ncbi:MAG: hypothetical protein F6K62_26895 [Sphaerospermopsis sp. SIO1G2]|nr:hypothetical protein [Sphaerospermopsis sp. SIO1G2]